MRLESFRSGDERNQMPHSGAESEAEPEKEFQSHEIILADSDLENAERILERQQISYRKRPYTPRELIDEATHTHLPGEYIIEVMAPHSSVPADVGYVERVLATLRRNEIIVRRARGST